jgi:hypothetical protein
MKRKARGVNLVRSSLGALAAQPLPKNLLNGAGLEEPRRSAGNVKKPGMAATNLCRERVAQNICLRRLLLRTAARYAHALRAAEIWDSAPSLPLRPLFARRTAFTMPSNGEEMACTVRTDAGLPEKPSNLIARTPLRCAWKGRQALAHLQYTISGCKTTIIGKTRR